MSKANLNLFIWTFIISTIKNVIASIPSKFHRWTTGLPTTNVSAATEAGPVMIVSALGILCVWGRIGANQSDIQ